MSFLWVTITIFHLISISFMGIVVMRLFAYVRRYKLNENHHTLLFGFIGIGHIVSLYIVIMAVFTVGSLVFVQLVSGG